MRNGQAYCTDNECTDLTNPMTTPNATTDNLMLMGLLTVGAVMMYYFRPNSLRRRQRDDLNKPVRLNDGVSFNNQNSLNYKLIKFTLLLCRIRINRHHHHLLQIDSCPSHLYTENVPIQFYFWIIVTFAVSWRIISMLTRLNLKKLIFQK